MAEITKKSEQTMRYSDEELSFIKNTFCENEVLVKVLRKVLLQAEMTEDETKVLTGFASNGEAVRILRKALLPNIDASSPMGQMVDLYSNIDTKEHGVERAYPLMLARDLLCDYLEQQFKILTGDSTATNIVFSSLARAEGKDPEEAYVQLSMRNTLVQHVEQQLIGLKLLAGWKEETVEQTKNRIAKNSNK